MASAMAMAPRQEGRQGEQRVVSTANHIIDAISASAVDPAMANNIRAILSSFDGRLASLSSNSQDPQAPVPLPAPLPRSAALETLDRIEFRILRWDDPNPGSNPNSGLFLDGQPPPPSTRHSMIWDHRNPYDAQSYLGAVDDLQLLLSGSTTCAPVLVERARRIHSVAMARLEEEFRHVLLENVDSSRCDSLLDNNKEGEEEERWIPGDPLLSSRSSSDKEEEEEEEEEDGDENDDDIPVAEVVPDWNEVCFDLVPSNKAWDLHRIAKRLVSGGHAEACCRVYVGIRKPVVEESLCRLGAERVFLGAARDEIQTMRWETLQVKVKKWIHAFRACLKVVFASERRLCDLVFSKGNKWGEACFAELATRPMLDLLSFADTVASSRPAPEKLSKLLDMHEILEELSSEIDAIFSDDACVEVRREVDSMVSRLGDAARVTFAEFESAITRDNSRMAAPPPGAGIHPLTRYVMNYINLLFDYDATLARVLHGPLAARMAQLTVALLGNLEAKSRSYIDAAHAYLFLMNNVGYIMGKTQKQPRLADALGGDDWVRKHSAQIRQYGIGYVRVGWKRVFSCLKDDTAPVSLPRVAVKERFKTFNSVFQEVYQAQASLSVPDPSLREDLRISIAEKLIPAYRAFLRKFKSQLGSSSGKYPDKYVKYTLEDLENYLVDLFEGSKSHTTH